MDLGSKRFFRLNIMDLGTLGLVNYRFKKNFFWVKKGILENL